MNNVIYDVFILLMTEKVKTNEIGEKANRRSCGR